MGTQQLIPLEVVAQKKRSQAYIQWRHWAGEMSKQAHASRRQSSQMSPGTVLCGGSEHTCELNLMRTSCRDLKRSLQICRSFAFDFSNSVCSTPSSLPTMWWRFWRAQRARSTLCRCRLTESPFPCRPRHPKTRQIGKPIASTM